ncbi:TPA: hypothetical protein DCQ85_02715 [Candidatus Magasanikbacteria bacterium]|nr:MAG: hypothetical protein A2488_00635 [Candidatus Magasanikbacteria bacterium RIFOXYC12_FULL_32_21b]OGH88308.1 MAG: hypothetical protein A2507_01630 [Candidatus Magasanikbacteria bacterium RIFOXYD12_FULL_33_17]HAO52356.1 hypothetical protein [Candidatus Magasanikbacteria bacterium]
MDADIGAIIPEFGLNIENFAQIREVSDSVFRIHPKLLFVKPKNKWITICQEEDILAYFRQIYKITLISTVS